MLVGRRRAPAEPRPSPLPCGRREEGTKAAMVLTLAVGWVVWADRDVALLTMIILWKRPSIFRKIARQVCGKGNFFKTPGDTENYINSLRYKEFGGKALKLKVQINFKRNVQPKVFFRLKP